MTYVALLRGINVGGKNKVPMKALIPLFVDSGCDNVRAYIQSGNVIFTANSAVSAKIPSLVPGAIQKCFGCEVPVILRNAEQLAKVLRANPFLKRGAAESELHVLFLADAADPARIRNLDPDRSPPDQFEVRGQEIYLRLPNGAGRSKLTNQYFDSKLATVTTGRNWRTVNKILELMLK